MARTPRPQHVQAKTAQQWVTVLHCATCKALLQYVRAVQCSANQSAVCLLHTACCVHVKKFIGSSGYAATRLCPGSSAARC